MRFVRPRSSDPLGGGLEDPMAGVANLFDASLAFIVALLVVLFAASGLLDLLDPESDFTLLKQNADGSMELIVKEGEEIEVQEVTDTELEGRGTLLGAAYRLEDGRVIYVPESGEGEVPR